MSSVQLLDKTRKIGKLLHNNNSSKVVFSDICKVMREILNSNVLVISRKGKVLGVGKSDGIEPITELLDDNIGGFIDPMLNERLLGVLSTKENVNLETLGFENTDTRKFQAIITPIEIAGERLGTLFIYKCNEQYDIDDIIDDIKESKKRGKKNYIIINAEGVGDSVNLAKTIEERTGMETRATILGHMQRGGSPTCKDRVYASMMGALAVDLLIAGKTCRVVGYRHGEFVDFDINEALAMQKGISDYQWEVCQSLSHNYDKNNK